MWCVQDRGVKEDELQSILNYLLTMHEVPNSQHSQRSLKPTCFQVALLKDELLQECECVSNIPQVLMRVCVIRSGAVINTHYTLTLSAPDVIPLSSESYSLRALTSLYSFFLSLPFTFFALFVSLHIYCTFSSFLNLFFLCLNSFSYTVLSSFLPFLRCPQQLSAPALKIRKKGLGGGDPPFGEVALSDF